jgi:hypothetical protein
MAYENACFVIVAREVLSPDDRRDGLPLPGVFEAHGGSAIIAPGGEYLAGPGMAKDTLVVAEIDLARTIEAKRWFDRSATTAVPTSSSSAGIDVQRVPFEPGRSPTRTDMTEVILDPAAARSASTHARASSGAKSRRRGLTRRIPTTPGQARIPVRIRHGRAGWITRSSSSG